MWFSLKAEAATQGVICCRGHVMVQGPGRIAPRDWTSEHRNRSFYSRSDRAEQIPYAGCLQCHRNNSTLIGLSVLLCAAVNLASPAEIIAASPNGSVRVASNGGADDGADDGAHSSSVFLSAPAHISLQ
jgi:hypothetical protein